MAEKSKGTAAVLCFFLGMFGIHRFYLGKTGTGVLQLVIGILGSLLLFIGIGAFLIIGLAIWVIIDFILILTGNLKEKVPESVKMA